MTIMSLVPVADNNFMCTTCIFVNQNKLFIKKNKKKEKAERTVKKRKIIRLTI